MMLAVDAPSHEEIRRQVEEICQSPALNSAPRRRDLLRRIVEGTLTGKPETETTLALAVYGKDPDTFYPSVDSIVRVETSKLRKALKMFYAGKVGKGALVRINIAAGYVAQVEYTANHVSALVDNVAVPARYRDFEDVYLTRHHEKGQLQLPASFVTWLCGGEDQNGTPLILRQARYFPHELLIYSEKTARERREADTEREKRGEDVDWVFVYNTVGNFDLEMDNQGRLTIPRKLSWLSGIQHGNVVLWMSNQELDHIVVQGEESWLAFYS